MYTSNDRIKNAKSKFLRISSNEKTDDSLNNSVFSVNIPQSDYIDNVKGFYVHSIECPNVFNNVDTYNNNYQIKFQGPSAPIDLNLNLSIGYYLIDDLINAMNAQISAQIAANGDTYTFVLSKVGIFPNEKIQINASGITTGQASLISSDNTLWPSLGIITTPDAIPPNNPVTINNGVPYTAQNIPNLIGATALYVHSRALATNNLVEKDGVFSTVDKLNLDKAFGAVCYSNFNNDTTHEKRYFPFSDKRSLRKIDIKLRDINGNILLLPPNFNFTMMLKIFYS
jgi:hypothetical protein